VLRCTQRRGCCHRRGLGAAVVAVAATRHSARMYSAISKQQVDKRTCTREHRDRHSERRRHTMTHTGGEIQ
jgi:ERCC4-related helicase